MPWDLRHVRVFIAVAENLHFSRAAQALHVAQSAVSRTVRWMEQDLKVPLLTRNTRNVALTAEGVLLLEECRHIAAQFDKSIKRTRSISAGLAGELDIGCNDFAFLGELPIIGFAGGVLHGSTYFRELVEAELAVRTLTRPSRTNLHLIDGISAGAQFALRLAQNGDGPMMPMPDGEVISIES